VAGNTRPNAYSGVQRSTAQGALWRLANATNQINTTGLTMPGLR